MKLAVMQPYFLPYIGYFQLINAVDKFVVLDDVSYIKKGWINRNNILVNDKQFMFSVPLIHASQNRLINETRLNITEKWRSDFLKTIEFNYKKAPYFSEIFYLIEGIVNFSNDQLSKWIFFQLRMICEYLKIDTVLVESSTIYRNRHLKGQNRILDICLKEKTSIYINPIGGVDLYEKQLFTKNGMTLYFLKSEDICYRQFGNIFIPALSILDVMMFNSRHTIKQMLNQYILI